MKYFSLPADFKKETIDKYFLLNRKYLDSKVATTYGNISRNNIFGSGRDLKKIPDVDLESLSEYVRYSNDKGIDFSYTLNASSMQNREFTPAGLGQVKRFLQQLKMAGISTIIVSIPSLIEAIRSFNLGFRIKASVICQITNPNKAVAFKKMGADSIVVDESVNRNFGVLRRIVEAFGDGVEVIANSICHQDCHYRMFHYNQISCDSIDQANPVSCNYYTTKCVMRLYEDISNFLRLTWIRPEDIKHYTAIGIQHFKIQGRQAVLTGNPVKAVEYYFKESYTGDFKDLLVLFSPFPYCLNIPNHKLSEFLKPFYEQKSFCRRDCETCGYCLSYARKCFDYARDELKASQALEKIKEADGFKRLIDDLIKEEG